MKLTIVLKKEDADGLGGEILTDLGMTQSETDPQVFWVYHSFDPAVVAPADVAPGMWATKYVEALSDRGIRPLRVFQRTNSMLELPQVQAGAEVQAAVFSAAQYAWYEYQGPDRYLKSRKGKSMALTAGTVFGVRPATSEKGMMRVIFEELGKQHVFSMSQKSTDTLISKSRTYTRKVRLSAAIDKKEWRRARKLANEALVKAGFEGNKPFGSVGRAFSDAVAVLRQHDMDQAEPFMPLVNQVEGKANLDLLFHNKPAPGMLAFLWYKKDSGAFEVVAYVS